MPDSNRRLVYSTDDGEIQQPKEKKSAPAKGKAPAKKEAPTLAATNKTVYVQRARRQNRDGD
jgi:hypothetical protein